MLWQLDDSKHEPIQTLVLRAINFIKFTSLRFRVLTETLNANKYQSELM